MDISYLAITLEHSTKDLLKVCKDNSFDWKNLLLFQLANDYVNRLGKHEITANDIDLVMNADNVRERFQWFLSPFFFLKIFLEILRSDLNTNTISSSTSIYHLDTSISTMTYNELIRHFMITESQYKDDLELLIKFFRNPLRSFFSEQFEVR